MQGRKPKKDAGRWKKERKWPSLPGLATKEKRPNAAGEKSSACERNGELK